jgi:hypothetical protein
MCSERNKPPLPLSPRGDSNPLPATKREGCHSDCVSWGIKDRDAVGANSSKWVSFNQRVFNDLQRDKAFLRLYDSAPRPSPILLSRQQAVTLSQSSCVSQIELTAGRPGRDGEYFEQEQSLLFWPDFSLSFIDLTKSFSSILTVRTF